MPAMPSNALALNDIHLPAQISDYPLAYGWWILLATIIIIIVLATYKMIKRKQLKRQQKQALKQLKTNPNMTNNDILKLLKWAALQYFPRTQVAPLYGENFQQFLWQQLAEKHQEHFKKLTAQSFTGQYQAQTLLNEQATVAALYQGAKLWLSHALPPKAEPNNELPAKPLGAKR